MIITVTLNPAQDKRLTVGEFCPGETNKCVLQRIDVSGKGINVSKALAALGRKSVAAGFMGDINAHIFTDYLSERGIAHDFIYIKGEARTNVKLTETISGRETEINEDGPFVTDADVSALIKNLEKYYNKDNIICVSGSLPRGVPLFVYRDIILKAKEKGTKIIFDSSGGAFEMGIEAAPYAIKPNIHEFNAYVGADCKTPRDIMRSAAPIIKGGANIVIVSMGSGGACFFTKEYAITARVTEQIPVCGAIGAGDAMCAGLAAALDDHADFFDTVRLCVASAAASVMEEGTMPGALPNIKRLEGLVEIKDI